ncbi:MAG: leucine-rich repeat domain-containing protein [Clostridiales bacterium]|nr:leucine-rich repeat domain-containing protein [Clostridiales bacterium]
MNNKKLIALLLAAMMSVSTASVAFAAPEDEITKGYPDGDVWESKLYNAMLEAGDSNDDGKLTEGEAAAIETLTIDSLSLGALKGLENCTGLTSLTVTDSQVQDLSFLSGLTSLTSLTLSGNNIQDLSALSSLTSLKTLDLSGNNIQDLSALSSLTSLETLDLSDNASLADLSTLSGLSKLKTLDVSNTKVRDLTGLPTGLTSLKASGNNIEDMSKISGLTSLETLDLSNNLISVLTDLSGFSKLENLNLQGNSFSNIDSLESKLPASIKDNADWKNSVFGTPSSETVDKTALKAAIANAQALLDATVSSENGADVAKTEKWATAANIATLTDAIKAAQAVVDDGDASKEVVEQAVTDLNGAKSTFEGQRKDGTANYDPAPLKNAVEDAKKLLESVIVADSADEVDQGKQWVTQAVYDALNKAISDAEAVLGGSFDTDDTVTPAVTALNQEMSTFNKAIDFGTKPTTPTNPTPSTSREYSDYFGNEKWDELKDEIAQLIEDGKEGETIEFNATGLPYFPASVARALKGEDITLKVRKNGVTYTINGLEIGTVHKIWYDFEDIESELLTADGAEDETSSSTGDKENPSTGR